MTGNCELYSERNELPSVYATSYGYHVGLVINPKSLSLGLLVWKMGTKRAYASAGYLPFALQVYSPLCFTCAGPTCSSDLCQLGQGISLPSGSSSTEGPTSRSEEGRGVGQCCHLQVSSSSRLLPPAKYHAPTPIPARTRNTSAHRILVSELQRRTRHEEKRQKRSASIVGTGPSGPVGLSQKLILGNWPPCTPLCPSRRKRSPPCEGRRITVGLAKCHRTHMLWTGVSVMPETREDIPTQGDNLAQAVSGPYLSRQKCSGPEKACLSMAKQGLKNCMGDNICPWSPLGGRFTW